MRQELQERAGHLTLQPCFLHEASLPQPPVLENKCSFSKGCPRTQVLVPEPVLVDPSNTKIKTSLLILGRPLAIEKSRAFI